MPPLSSRFTDALALAAELHSEQTRKATGVPYVSHLLGVASLVLEYGGDEDAAIAGLLHDAVEDQGGRPTLDLIRDRFGERVAGMVEALSDHIDPPKPKWKVRKDAYIAHVREAEPAVRLISACDSLHNVRGFTADFRRLGPDLWKTFTGGSQGLVWYYRSLAAVYADLGPADVAAELTRALDAFEGLSSDVNKGM